MPRPNSLPLHPESTFQNPLANDAPPRPIPSRPLPDEAHPTTINTSALTQLPHHPPTLTRSQAHHLKLCYAQLPHIQTWIYLSCQPRRISITTLPHQPDQYSQTTKIGLSHDLCEEFKNRSNVTMERLLGLSPSLLQRFRICHLNRNTSKSRWVCHIGELQWKRSMTH